MSRCPISTQSLPPTSFSTARRSRRRAALPSRCPPTVRRISTACAGPDGSRRRCSIFWCPEVAPGVTTAHLDKLAFEYAMDHGALPACLGYRGYRHTLCTSVNHVVCHGIPADRPLKDGDILNIDVTLIVDGWHGDTSRMYYVGEVKRKAQRLVEITYEVHDARHPGGEAGRDHGRHRLRHPVLRRRAGALLGGARFLRPRPGAGVPRAAQHRPLRAPRSGRRH